MTDEFLTKGLEDDRYLKALRLIAQFDSEIEARLQQFGGRMTEQQPRLFESPIDGRVRTNQRPSTGLALHRVDYALGGAQAPTTDKTLKLNVHLYWMDPAAYTRTDVDGALRMFGYKIKNADTAIDARIADQTRAGDWDVEISENPYDSNLSFYRHVSSVAEIDATTDTLVNHFSTFGDEYAVVGDES